MSHATNECYSWNQWNAIFLKISSVQTNTLRNSFSFFSFPCSTFCWAIDMENVRIAQLKDNDVIACQQAELLITRSSHCFIFHFHFGVIQQNSIYVKSTQNSLRLLNCFLISLKIKKNSKMVSSFLLSELLFDLMELEAVSCEWRRVISIFIAQCAQYS